MLIFETCAHSSEFSKTRDSCYVIQPTEVTLNLGQVEREPLKYGIDLCPKGRGRLVLAQTWNHKWTIVGLRSLAMCAWRRRQIAGN